jgi:Glycosyltransferase family 87
MTPVLRAATASHDWVELSIGALAGISVAIAALFLCAVPFAGHLAASRDFISYWSAGWQLVHHANPYDRAAVGNLEHAMGFDARGILVMRNPPWALPLAYPLGFLDLRVAVVLWTLLLVACLIVSVFIVHRLHDSPPNNIRWLGFAFTPAIICLIMGQTSLFVLLGLALFLRYHSSRPFAAGAALWFCALKPHLFLPFGIALLAWMVFTRAWKIAAGAAVTLAAATALGFLLAPHAWPDYIAMLRSPLVAGEAIPCIGNALGHWFFPAHHWTQYLPVALACLWAFGYYWRRCERWDWISNGSLLMLISLLLGPYVWLYDQCLLVPALLHAAYCARSRPPIGILSLLILSADLQLCFLKVTSPLWIWTAPAWFAWYLLAQRSTRKQEVHSHDIQQLIFGAGTASIIASAPHLEGTPHDQG